MKCALLLLALWSCHGEEAPPPPPPAPPPALSPDPVAAGGEPTHGEAVLPFTITNIKTQLGRQLAPPFYGEVHGNDVPLTYVEISVGGGTFGWLAQSGDYFDNIELIPTSSADGAKVAHAFASSFTVYEPKPTAAGELRPAKVGVKILSHANAWFTTVWTCDGGDVYVQFNFVARTGRFVQKNRDGSWNWAACLAGTLRDGA